MIFLHKKALLLISLFILSISACKEVETVVVTDITTVENGNPIYSSSVNSLKLLKIGSVGVLTKPDPLKIETVAMRRIAHLIYDRLVMLDSNNQIIPGIARSWEVSSDKKKYTFYLHKNLFFHNSDLFLNGQGRKVNAYDVTAVFNRMAKPGVIHTASDYYWNITGFDVYYHEQRLPEHLSSNLTSIPGVEVVDEYTIIFNLDFPDPHFLTKLADPISAIYPSDAIDNSTNSLTHFVGSNSYQYEEMINDTTLLLTVNSNGINNNSNLYNELVFYFSKYESVLFKHFILGNLDLIAEPGPKMNIGLMNSEGNLKPEYITKMNLYRAPADRTWKIFHNLDNKWKLEEDHSLFLLQSFSTRTNLPDRLAINGLDFLVNGLETRDSLKTPTGPIGLSYHREPIPFDFWQLFKQNQPEQANYFLSNTSYLNRNILMVITSDDTLTQPKNLVPIAEFSTPVYSISHSGDVKISFNNSPWWIQISY